MNQEQIGLIEYNLTFTQYVSSQKITSDCNEIWFFNYGQQPIIINGCFQLIPANTLEKGRIDVVPPPVIPMELYMPANNCFHVRGNLFEIDRTQYDIAFGTGEIQDGTQQLLVVRKTYKRQDRVEQFMSFLAGHYGK